MTVAAINRTTPNRTRPLDNPKRPPLLPSDTTTTTTTNNNNHNHNHNNNNRINNNNNNHNHNHNNNNRINNNNNNHNNNRAAPRKPKSREVASRYLSSSSVSSSTSTTSSSNTNYSTSSSSNSTPSFRRFASPIPQRTPLPAATPARAQSVERRRQPTTPATATTAAAKMLLSSKRSLSVSFQGEAISVPVIGSSKEKPAPVMSLRKAVVTPVRENSSVKAMEKHRWPGTRAMPVNSMMRSVDFGTKFGGSAAKALGNSSSEPRVGLGVFSGRSGEESCDRVVSDNDSVSSGSNSGVGTRGVARFWQHPGSPVSKSSNGVRTPSALVPVKLIGVKKVGSDYPVVVSSPRGVSPMRSGCGIRPASPSKSGVRPASPSKSVVLSGSFSPRGVSSSRGRNGAGSVVNGSLNYTSSVLNFAADARRGKVGENRIVDAHQLRLLYNQHLQWRFANARADEVMLVQKGIVEKSLYNAWLTTAKLWHSVKSKRIELQLLRQNLKTYSILMEQMPCLENWDLTDMDHSSSLRGATEALEASTLRLPVGSGARADVQDLKDAIRSADDVMHTLASSIFSSLIKLEHVNSLASELASITVEERTSLDQCRDFLSTLTAMQVKHCSLRTHILQLGVPSSLTTEV